MRAERHAAWIVAVAASAGIALLSPSCGGDKSPSTSTPTTTRPTPPPVSGYLCPFGQGSLTAACGTAGSRLSQYVETAIDLVVREKPQLVDITSQSPSNSDQYRVLDEEAFLDAMVENLRRQQVCAERDGDDLGSKHLLVKGGNEYSEAFDLLSPNGFLRRREASYLTTCTPASFPVERTSDMPSAGSGCGRPYPPPISRFNCKVHLLAPECYTVDATPIVGPNKDYCASVGYTDGRSLCPIRPEGFPDRIPCENWRVGRARDTGRYGPTWTNGEGVPCTGPDSNCRNSGDNQYQVCVFRSGRVKATAENGADCTQDVER